MRFPAIVAAILVLPTTGSPAPPTPKNPVTDAYALFAYSPYHHVADGTKYPPILMMTGANDPRVDPMQSRKMTARLQAAAAGSTLVLLRTSASSGHGIGSSLGERVREAADVDAFLFDRLGVDYKPAP